jgi:outer membrane protein assembly factor BamB
MRNRRIGHLAVVAAAVLALSGCWLQPRFTEGRTNYNAGEQALTAATVGSLTELWSTSIVSPGVTQAPVQAPVAFGDDIFVAATQFPLGAPGVAASLDADTGAVGWNTPLEIEFDSPVFVDDPAYHGGRVHIPFSADLVGGQFVLDPATGDVSQVSGIRRFPSDLAVVDGQLVTKTVAADPGFVGTQVTWSLFRPTVVSTGSVESDYAFVGDSIAWTDHISFTESGTSALGFSPQCPEPPGIPRTTACLPDWTTDLSAPPGSPTAVGDDAVVYPDSSGTVSVLDMATGAVQWQAELGAVTLTQATVTPELILVGTSDGRLVALPAGGCGAPTCDPLWEGTLSAGARSVVGAGDVAYVTTAGGMGTIAAFDLAGCGAATCDPLVTVSAGAEVWSGGIVHAGRLIVGTTDGRVVAFGLPG